MKTLFVYFLAICCLTFLYSCKKNDRKNEAQKVVTEWIGKKIEFPADIRCLSMGKDTICPTANNSYRILVYTDSVGCTTCKLRLSTWKDILQETDSLLPGKVTFLFYFHPKSEKELIHLLKRDWFDHPVFIDNKNKIDQLNNFPSQMEYQCFLLNQDNEVVLVGNPTLNPKIWELYKQTIMGNNSQEEEQPFTSAVVDQQEIELEELKVGEKSIATFTIKNTGSISLIISHIDASCGCTVPIWEKKPIKPNKETSITIEVTPEETGFFHKTIQVYTNIENPVIPLTIKGKVEKNLSRP